MPGLFEQPLNLILLVAAGFVVWRLFGILGQKTGHEGPGFDPFARNPAPSQEPPDAQTAAKTPEEPAKPVWHGIADEGSSLAKGLASIVQADNTFVPTSFIEGAKLAYEMIVEAFAKGDKPALKPLLNREVYDEFSSAIDMRLAQGHHAVLQFVGIKSAKITDATLSGKRAQITVRFVTDMISAITDRENKAVEGDTREIREIVDSWTFERETSARDPNWRLLDTCDAA
jgi:predicted lipid-binding transport protein (Tim44 family)